MPKHTPEGKSIVHKEDIVAALRELGIMRGDMLQVHSSLSRLGYVVGGADAVVDALLEAVGTEGTVMVPTFNHGRADIFDLHATPSVSGKITEALRARRQARRSMHPTHPYAAIGPKTEWLTEGHLETRTFGIQSPLGKLAHSGGWVLMLGVGMDSNTSAHVGETVANVHCLGYREFPRKVRRDDGTVIEAWSTLWRDGPCPVEFEPIEAEMRRRGMIRDGKVGDGSVLLMKGQDVVDVTYELCQRICPSCSVMPRRDP